LEELEERKDDDQEEWEEEEWDEQRFELEMRELELRHHAIEVQMAELELKSQRAKLFSNSAGVAFEAMDLAREHMETEEAVDFFAGLLEETEQYPIGPMLRQRPVELNFELGRREEAIKHLRALIVPDEH
jgi:hypothetical protein